MDKRIIYFNEELHKYTDEFNNPYVSATTLIGKYAPKFDTDKMAQLCARSGLRGNPKYAGKTAAQLKREWLQTSEEACDKGNYKHNFLEVAIKNSNGYKKNAESLYINDRIYTVGEIIENHELGRVDLEYFEQQGINEKYPVIYKLLNKFINRGYRLHTEIGVYNPDFLISGLIDLFLIKDYNFVIIDWKTNRSPIRYESGYYEKDIDGNITDNYIRNNERFKAPLTHLESSTGNKYTMQLSTYDYLAEGFGLTFDGNILCHIRGEEPNETVDLLPIKYFKKEVYNLFTHHKKMNSSNNQYALQI